jgi:tetratricopeptide (TPR) repeat protein
MSIQGQDISEEMAKVNVMIEEGDFSGALSMLEEFVSSGNDQPFLHLALGEVHRSLNSNDNAKKCYEMALNQKSDCEDSRVRVAAKAGLANLYLKDAWDDFDALKPIEQIDELRELLPNYVRSRLFRFVTFASQCGDCQKDGNPGYWVYLSPTIKACKRC